MHDIGNAINRSHHAEYGALLANSILEKTDIRREDRITIISAIGNHDESTGGSNGTGIRSTDYCRQNRC